MDIWVVSYSRLLAIMNICFHFSCEWNCWVIWVIPCLMASGTARLFSKLWDFLLSNECAVLILSCYSSLILLTHSNFTVILIITILLGLKSYFIVLFSQLLVWTVFYSSSCSLNNHFYKESYLDHLIPKLVLGSSQKSHFFLSKLKVQHVQRWTHIYLCSLLYPQNLDTVWTTELLVKNELNEWSIT